MQGSRIPPSQHVNGKVGGAPTYASKAILATVSGGTLTATRGGSTIMLMDESGGMAHVSIPDVVPSNGVIHVVDEVLLPK